MGAAVRIGDGEAWIQLESASRGADHEGYSTRAQFYKGGLSGIWDLDLFDVPGFADELDALHKDLTREAELSDHDGFHIRFSINATGQVTAHAWVNCTWAFGVAGVIEFDIRMDQTHLPMISESVRSAFPPIEAAPRRAVA